MKNIYTGILIVAGLLFFSNSAIAQISFGTADGNQGCKPFQAIFYNSSTTGNHFIWRFGDGDSTISNSRNSVTHTYTNNGTYYPTLLGYNNSTYIGSSRDSVFVKSNLHFGNPYYNYINASETTACPGDSINFYVISQSALADVLWNFGDGGSSKALNPNHAFTSFGQYTVKATITNYCGIDTTLQIQINVTGNNHFPGTFQIFSSETTACPGDVINFFEFNSYLVNNEIAHREWLFGDGDSTTSLEPSHVYALGTYTLREKLTNNCGVDTSIQVVISVMGNVHFSSTCSISPSEAIVCPEVYL